MKFGLLFLPSGWKGTTDHAIYHQLLEQACLAEELGYDSVWLTEHRFTQYGRPAVSPLAAAIAARTSRIRIGSSVYVLPIHHPIEVAEDAAVVDILSNGRLEFGVGRGYQPEELEAFEVDFDSCRERHNEALQVIVQAWTTGYVEHQGKYWRIPRREFRPLPVQKPHPPIWQPIVSPGTFEESVSLGKNAIMGSYMSPLSRVEQAFKTWFETLERHGLRRDALHTASPIVVHVGQSDAHVRRACEDSYVWNARTFGSLLESGRPELKRYYAELTYESIVDGCTLSGTPERVREQVAWLQSFGMEELVCLMNLADMDHQAVMDSMRLFATDVMPYFR